MGMSSSERYQVLCRSIPLVFVTTFLEAFQGLSLTYEELEIIEGCVFEGWREDSELHLTEDDPGARSRTFFCQDSWD